MDEPRIVAAVGSATHSSNPDLQAVLEQLDVAVIEQAMADGVGLEGDGAVEILRRKRVAREQYLGQDK